MTVSPPFSPALNDSERIAEQRRIALDAITDFTYIFDLQGRFTFVNRPLLDLWGITLEQAVGKNFFDLKYPDDLAAKLQRQIHHVIHTRERLVDETPYTSPTGAGGYYQYIFTPVIGDDGRVHAVAGSTRDITQQKHTESLARTILESISDAFFALDHNWKFTYVNPQAERLLNRVPGDLLGKSIWEEYTGLHGSIFEPIYRRAATERIAGTVTSYYPDHDRWYEVHAYPAPDGISIYFRNVSERIRAEEQERRATAEAFAAAEANAKFRTFFEQGSQFAGVMSVDGTIIEANRLCLDACGFTREEVIGKKFWDCGWWNRSPELMELVRKGSAQAAAGEIFRMETSYFIADGTQRIVDLIIAPVKDAAGRVLFIAPTGTDITNRKAAEVALREARDAAEAANRSKDRFLAVLSHELRTPLSPVVMTIPSLELDPEMPFKFREDLAMMRRNIELEVKLIDDLLDLSRVTSGKLRLHLQNVSVHEILRYAIQNSTSDSSGKKLHIHADLAAAHDRLNADPARLQQVFWNLLRNAIKFTPEGRAIYVRTCNTVAGQLSVEIQDTGVGIPPEFLPRIFDAFEQGDARMTRQFGGLGLGLAIAKAVVEMHGGSITAHSAGRDQGAIFTVLLATAPVASVADNSSPTGQSTPVPAARTRILLVEDHPDTARTMTRILTSSGFEVRTAHCVADALRLAAAEPFAVLVSDIGLPDNSGYELMRIIHARHAMKGIALSGYGMEEDIRKAREAGFAEHLVKPVNIPHLEAAIRRVVNSP